MNIEFWSYETCYFLPSSLRIVVFSLDGDISQLTGSVSIPNIDCITDML